MVMSSGLKEAATSRVEATYAALRDLIVDGQLAPGTRIVETDLAPQPAHPAGGAPASAPGGAHPPG